MMEFRLKHIHKSYPGQVLYDDFSITFAAGQITCILGPSGCGKTTLLNIICGNTAMVSGDRSGFEKSTFSYIFQEPRLLPWKTVAENVGFPLKERMDAGNYRRTVLHYLEMVSLVDKENLLPYQLSGGMKQRVSLARAFAFPSDIILMDEPFKGLDYKLKNNLMDSFIDLWEEDPRTVISVTHEVDEALYLGHEVIIFGHPPVQVLGTYHTGLATRKNLNSKELLEMKAEIIGRLSS